MVHRLIITCIFLFNLSAFSQISNLDHIVEKYREQVSEQKFGIIALVKHDDSLKSKAIGWASDSLKMTKDKVFNIGSVTKMFTSVLIMQEVEKGNLKLNDTIGRFFPENKNVAPSITIEQLLRHRSGLGELVVDTLINRASMNYFDAYNTSNLYYKIPEKSRKNGESYQYTNTNYILLGYLLEMINDKPYSEILRDRIFKVLGMKNSYGNYSKFLYNSAHPMYDGEDLNNYINFKFYKDYLFSAGAIASSVADLEKFFTALYETQKLVSYETFDLMTTFEDDYGLGIQKYNAKSNKGDYILIGHGGDSLSFKVRNYYNPLTRDLVIVIANEYGVSQVSDISNELLKALE